MLTPIKPIEPCCDSCSSGCCNCTKADIGLDNVDNTSDLNKPISTATQSALNGKVNLTAFNALLNRVTALENESWDITELTTRVGTLETNTTAMGDILRTLSDRFDSMVNSFNGLSIRVADAETNIGALDEEMPNTVKLTGRAEQTVVGLLKANDPDSGATDKTLVTANWVSQTGDSSPNNLIHRSGNETKTGIFTVDQIRSRIQGYPLGSVTASYNKFYRLFTFAENSNLVFRCKGYQPNNNIGWIQAFIGGTPMYQRSELISKVSRYKSASIIICNNTSTNRFEVIIATGNLVGGIIELELMEGYFGNTFALALDEVSDPSTDGIHNNIQVLT